MCPGQGLQIAQGWRKTCSRGEKKEKKMYETKWVKKGLVKNDWIVCIILLRADNFEGKP